MNLSPRALAALVMLVAGAAWWFTRAPAEAPSTPPPLQADGTVEPRSAAGAQVEAMRAAAQESVDQHADRMANVEEQTE
jgi:hypothetical protein